MKFALLFLFLIFTASCSGQTGVNQSQTSNQAPEISNPAAKQPVLIELFTSEG